MSVDLAGRSWPAVFIILAGTAWMAFCFWPEIHRLRIVGHDKPGEFAGPLIFAGLAALTFAAVGVWRFSMLENQGRGDPIAELRAVPTAPSPPLSSSTTVADSPVRQSLRQRVKVLTEELDRFVRERDEGAPRLDPFDVESNDKSLAYEKETAAQFKQRFAGRIDSIVAELRSYGVHNKLIDDILKYPVPGNYHFFVTELPPLVDSVP